MDFAVVCFRFPFPRTVMTVLHETPRIFHRHERTCQHVSAIDVVLLSTFNRNFYVSPVGSSIPTMRNLLRDTDMSMFGSAKESSCHMALE